MANQITDNRTLVDSAEATTNYVATSSATLDTEIFIQGAGSIGEQISNTRRYIMYNAGSAQDWSNNVFYIWINCGIVGLLDLKANGGFTIRFAGPTVTDFFEFYVGGSDSWPAAIAGGWVQFVVDIEATASNTGGTPPATTAIQHIGYSAVTAGTMTRNTDNTWIDEMRRLPDGSPGIIIEGRNGGVTDWNSADIVTQLGQSVGTFKDGVGGSYNVNTPIQFGINDTTTHAFTDTNKIWLWEDQEFAPVDLYKLSALGNSGGTTNVTMGVKTGTLDDATGSQGLTIAAAVAGVRWDADFNDPNIDGINLYGCQLIHGGAFLFDDPAVSCISTSYIDVTSALVSNSEQLRVSVIDANTIAGAAFMTTDDLSDIVFSTFQYSAGHGVELTTPLVATQASKGNLFVNYLGTPGTNLTPASGSTGAAVYNNAGGAVTINVTNSGDSPSVRNGASATTTVNNNTSVTFTGMKDNTEVRIYEAGTNTVVDGIENVTAGTVDNRSFTWSAAAALSVDYVLHNFLNGVPMYQSIRVNAFSVPSTDTSIPIQQILDRNVE